MSKSSFTVGDQLVDLIETRPSSTSNSEAPATDAGLLDRIQNAIRTGINAIGQRRAALSEEPEIPTQWLLEQAIKLIEEIYHLLYQKGNRNSRQQCASEAVEEIRVAHIQEIEVAIKDKERDVHMDSPIREAVYRETRVVAMLSSITQAIGMRMRSTAPGVLIPTEDETDPLLKWYRQIADEITLYTRTCIGSYKSTARLSRPEPHVDALQRAIHSAGHLSSLLNDLPPINGPASIHSMAHQYAQPADSTFAIANIVAEQLQTNSAHGALAGVDHMRAKSASLAMKYFGCTPDKSKPKNVPDPIFIGVDSGTRGNELGVRYLLRLARLGPAFFAALQNLPYLPRISIDDQHVQRFLPNHIEDKQTCFQDITPQEAATLPPWLICEFFQILNDNLKKYNKHPEAHEQVMAELHSGINHEMHSGLMQGQETVVFCSDLLHYTLQQAINTERREETVVTIPSDEHQRADFRAYEQQIEDAVKEGKQVTIFAAAGNTSFGSVDEFNFLADLKQRLQETYDRSFHLHVDAAWGWTVRSVILGRDNKPKDWEAVQNHPMFQNGHGRELYDALLKMPDAFDTLTFDAHKDGAPYSSAGFLAKEPWFMASLLTEKVPYLDVDAASGHADVDAMRTALCSHPPTVDMYMYLTMNHWNDGLTRRRHEALLQSAELAQQNLAKEEVHMNEGHALRGRSVRMVPVTEQSSRIITFCFIPDGATDVREVDDLNTYIASTFNGVPEVDGIDTGGIHLSKTVVDVSKCPSLENLTPTVSHINVVRLCITNDRQMQDTTEVEGWDGGRGHFGYFVHHIQNALDCYVPKKHVSRAPVTKDVESVVEPNERYRSPILTANGYTAINFFRDVLELLQQPNPPSNFRSISADEYAQHLVSAFNFNEDEPGCIGGLLRTVADVVDDMRNCNADIPQAMDEIRECCQEIQKGYRQYRKAPPESPDRDSGLLSTWETHAPRIASAIQNFLGIL